MPSMTTSQGNAAKFALQWGKEVDVATTDALRGFKAVMALRGLNMIDQTFPVDTGEHRANTRVYKGRPSGRHNKNLRAPDSQGLSTEPARRSKAIAILKRAKPAETVGIENSGPASWLLEFEGWSAKGSHMFTRAAANLAGFRMRVRDLDRYLAVLGMPRMGPGF